MFARLRVCNCHPIMVLQLRYLDSLLIELALSSFLNHLDLQTIIMTFIDPREIKGSVGIRLHCTTESLFLYFTKSPVL
jgi:hypothetical protein